MKSILIIEDHIGLREAYQLLFIKEGFKVTTAKDGAEGLELAGASNYDIILLDMLMPYMDGPEFIRTYKPLEHPKTKVIVFSNMQSEEYIKQAMELGVKKYLTKSIMPPKDMLKAVNAVLNDD